MPDRLTSSRARVGGSGAIMEARAASAERTISTRAPDAARTGSMAARRAGSGDASRKVGLGLASILEDLRNGCIGDD
jgi:hypothetical protein